LSKYGKGITANPKSGENYVSTFNFGGNNKLLRFSPNDKRLAQKDFGGTPLLGLAFNPKDKKVYIAYFGASMIQRISKNFDSPTPFEDVANIPAVGAPPIRIVRNPDGTEDEIVFGNDFPASNGLALNKDEDKLFITNTGDDRVLTLDLFSGDIAVFAESIDDADGIVLDKKENLWVAANQADQIMVLNEFGQLVAKLGEFSGI
jgi:DNA-binding beta-propeller fold protein YncE